jgi:hypothetical protein
MLIKTNYIHPFKCWGFVDAIYQPIRNTFLIYIQGSVILQPFRQAMIGQPITTIRIGRQNRTIFKVPLIAIVGEREAANGTVNLRRLGVSGQEEVAFAQLEEELSCDQKHGSCTVTNEG